MLRSQHGAPDVRKHSERLAGNDNMKFRLLFVISLTALATAAGTGVQAQREPATSPPPERNLVVAQKPQTALEPGDIFRDCEDCPELVVVPAGEFVMGANDTPYEKPERSITIPRPFAIG